MIISSQFKPFHQPTAKCDHYFFFVQLNMKFCTYNNIKIANNLFSIFLKISFRARNFIRRLNIFGINKIDVSYCLLSNISDLECSELVWFHELVTPQLLSFSCCYLENHYQLFWNLFLKHVDDCFLRCLLIGVS